MTCQKTEMICLPHPSLPHPIIILFPEESSAPLLKKRGG